MLNPIDVQCPWCLEWMELWVALDDTGLMTEDCQVCCRPWLVRISVSETGQPLAFIQRES